MEEPVPSSTTLPAVLEFLNHPNTHVSVTKYQRDADDVLHAVEGKGSSIRGMTSVVEHWYRTYRHRFLFESNAIRFHTDVDELVGALQFNDFGQPSELQRRNQNEIYHFYNTMDRDRPDPPSVTQWKSIRGSMYKIKKFIDKMRNWDITCYTRSYGQSTAKLFEVRSWCSEIMSLAIRCDTWDELRSAPTPSQVFGLDKPSELLKTLTEQELEYASLNTRLEALEAEAVEFEQRKAQLVDELALLETEQWICMARLEACLIRKRLLEIQAAKVAPVL